MAKLRLVLACTIFILLSNPITLSLGKNSAKNGFLLHEERWVKMFTKWYMGNYPFYEYVGNFSLCESVQQTKDGGYLVLVESYKAGGDLTGILLYKLDKYGKKEWVKRINALPNLKPWDEYLWIWHIEKTMDDCYIIAGAARVYSGDRKVDLWLIKVDENGNEIWNKTLGGKKKEVAHCIQSTDDGGYVAAGCTFEDSGFFTDGWIIKIDEHGEEVWNKSINVEGAVWTEFQTVCQAADESYMVGGRYFTSEDGGTWGACLYKLDKNGTEKWSRTFVKSGEYISIIGMIPDENGGCTVVGRREGVAWIEKIDSNGNTVWSRVFNRLIDPPWSAFISVRQTADGGYIALGWCNRGWLLNLLHHPMHIDFCSDTWLVKMDKEGKVEWRRVFPIVDMLSFPADIRITMDGGYIIVGSVDSYQYPGKWEGILIKTDSKGRTNFLQLKLSGLIHWLFIQLYHPSPYSSIKLCKENTSARNSTSISANFDSCIIYHPWSRFDFWI
ncbi:MAG: hypothetical protein J7K38_03485 [Thermoplasmata archaeon]|nr:hypothetical protein [Thermoplasmata archaeon]